MSPQEAMTFKNTMEREFEEASGLRDRRYYSAFYSLPQRSPVLWMNLNPGGTVADHSNLTDAQLLAGGHEFFDGHGKTSQATGAFLRSIMPQMPDAKLRSVQGTNVAWERSGKGRDIDLLSAARITAPHLTKFIRRVDPTIIFFGGAQARELFLQTAEVTPIGSSTIILGNWGRAQARIFISQNLSIKSLGAVRSITVSHPSRGARLPVVEAVRGELQGLELPLAIAQVA